MALPAQNNLPTTHTAGETRFGASSWAVLGAALLLLALAALGTAVGWEELWRML